MSNDVQQTIFTFVKQSMPDEAGDVAVGSNLCDDLGIDSLDIVEIVLKLEAKYEVKLPLEEMLATARVGMRDTMHTQDGVIAEASLARLRKLVPSSSR